MPQCRYCGFCHCQCSKPKPAPKKSRKKSFANHCILAKAYDAELRAEKRGPLCRLITVLETVLDNGDVEHLVYSAVVDNQLKTGTADCLDVGTNFVGSTIRPVTSSNDGNHVGYIWAARFLAENGFPPYLAGTTLEIHSGQGAINVISKAHGRNDTYDVIVDASVFDENGNVGDEAVLMVKTAVDRVQAGEAAQLAETITENLQDAGLRVDNDTWRETSINLDSAPSSVGYTFVHVPSVNLTITLDVFSIDHGCWRLKVTATQDQRIYVRYFDVPGRDVHAAFSVKRQHALLNHFGIDLGWGTSVQ